MTLTLYVVEEQTRSRQKDGPAFFCVSAFFGVSWLSGLSMEHAGACDSRVGVLGRDHRRSWG